MQHGHDEPANEKPIRSSKIRVLRWVVVFSLILVVVACGRKQEESTATPEPSVTVESPATAPATTVTQPEQPESPLVEAGVTTEQNAQPSAAEAGAPVTVTMDDNGTTAIFTPLEVDEGSKCDIEPHIDLAGYPNLEESLGCPTGEASTNPVAINEFGDGPEYDRFMLWFSDLDPSEQIYVLYPDNTWQSFPDLWMEGDPTFTCNPLDEEADSPPLPRRGFGKVWCENPELQDILGLVPKEERLCQHSVVQPFTDSRLLACFEEATIRYFHIYDDNTWQILVQ